MAQRPTLAFAALLVALVTLAYANSFGIGFHFDDIRGIAENRSITSLRNIPAFFADPFTLTTTRENVDVRPVLQITYALNYAISGLNPWSWHALNLVLHIGASLLVFLIVRDHLWPGGTDAPPDRATLVAGAASLFFALAPLNSQPLDYMWARSALLCTALYLAAFYCFVRGRWVAMGVLHALALLAKAIALTLPGAVLLYLVLYRADRTSRLRAMLRDWKSYRVPVGVLVALDAVYLVYRTTMLPAWAVSTVTEEFATPLVWFMSQWSAQLYYVRLFVWPDELSLDHAFPYAFHFFQPRTSFALIVILLWLGVAIGAVRRHPIVTFATLWFFLTLSVESSFLPLSEVVNDHRPYIATALGLAVLLAWALERATSRLGGRARPAFLAAAAILCAAAIPLTMHRNWQWGDYVRIWEDAAGKGPANGRAWMNAGAGLMRRGDYAGARRDFQRARDAAPGYAYVYMNLSVLEAHEGNLQQALQDAQRAVALSPGLSLTHYYLGQVLERLDRKDEAAMAYRRALAANPRDEAARAVLQGLEVETMMRAGLDTLYTRKDPAQAAATFRAVLAAMPAHYGATYQLAVALDAAGRGNEAFPLWQKMLLMAQAAHDPATIATCQARLARTP